LGQAEGYVKVLEKSNSSVFGLREVFEHYTESYSPSRDRLKVVLRDLPTLRIGEPAGAETVGVLLC
jgi:hypothetical protein